MMNSADAKRQRVIDVLEHREPDRVPIGEGFWTNFVRRCKEELDVGEEFNPYLYWDLDILITIPNMDPHITGVQVLEQSEERTLVKTGFGATIERHARHPMPHFNDFDTQSFEQMQAFEFDDPKDPRRFYEAIDDQINSVGDDINLGLAPFADRVKEMSKHMCVFGSVCEPHEMIWRIIGTENVLMKLGEDPEQVAQFIERLGDFLVGIVEGQVAAAGEHLTGLYIWGDIAYDRGMFFSPDYWRDVYKPQLKRICDAIHGAGLKAIYHGCGNASPVYDDMIEVGVDAYNPLEAKAGLDVVELKRKYKDRWSFNGNIDAQILSSNDREAVRREVLRKLNAAKGGGYILGSDHSVPDAVDPQTYGYMIELAREYGTYPLDLGPFDEEV
jgi:hypothetical protein